MYCEYVPLLQMQRDLYRIPLGQPRFDAYLRMMIEPSRQDLRYPFHLLNPMAKDHIATCYDTLLSFDADEIAAVALSALQPMLAGIYGESYRVALVVIDDLKGGWTNRYATDYHLRFPDEEIARRSPRWVTAIIWSGDLAPTIDRVREAVNLAVLRQAYAWQLRSPITLQDKLEREGKVMRQAGCTLPILDRADLEYTREVLRPDLNETDMRTAIQCMYGDEAGRTLGFPPKGLSPYAGLALALHDARRASR